MKSESGFSLAIMASQPFHQNSSTKMISGTFFSEEIWKSFRCQVATGRGDLFIWTHWQFPFCNNRYHCNHHHSHHIHQSATIHGASSSIFCTRPLQISCSWHSRGYDGFFSFYSIFYWTKNITTYLICSILELHYQEKNNG